MIEALGISEALGLARVAVAVTGEAATTADKIKGLFASGKSDANTETQELVNRLAQQLVTANLTNVQLSTALTDFLRRLQQEESFAARRAQYEHVQTAMGSNVLRLRGEFHSHDLPIHYACPVCVEDGKIAFLDERDHGKSLRCQRCRALFQVNRHEPLPGYSDESGF